jgi:hypothetical protein
MFEFQLGSKPIRANQYLSATNMRPFLEFLHDRMIGLPGQDKNGWHCRVGRVDHVAVFRKGKEGWLAILEAVFFGVSHSSGMAMKALRRLRVGLAVELPLRFGKGYVRSLHPDRKQSSSQAIHYDSTFYNFEKRNAKPGNTILILHVSDSISVWPTRTLQQTTKNKTR